MAARPLVSVYLNSKEVTGSVVLPAVFTAPIRPDLVHDVHARMRMNRRQPYAVSRFAGHQTSAESWGTGRAVARIPRVPGGGTHRAGQAAFGNMCRGGRMFAPTKTWRRWHRKVNMTEKRHAYASALAASALPALVMARGHKVDQISEIPLVIDNKAVDSIDKTSQAIAFLKSIGAYDDVEKVKDTIKLRAGKGKMRNRRWLHKRGPLIIMNKTGTPLSRALRNLPGVDICSVNKLNLLQLAPGGHLGRFVIWVKDAFEMLDSLFGTYRRNSELKSNYHLQTPLLTNPDLARIINSNEIQSVVKAKQPSRLGRQKRRSNPLRNNITMIRLNPYASVMKRRAILAEQRSQKKRQEVLEKKRKGLPVPKDPEAAKEKKEVKKILKARKNNYKTLLA